LTEFHEEDYSLISDMRCSGGTARFFMTTEMCGEETDAKIKQDNSKLYRVCDSADDADCQPL
jgi:hypothetical protein